MDPITTVHGHIAAGEVSAAMQLAQHLLETGQARLAWAGSSCLSMALKPAQKSPVFQRLAATWPVWT